MPYNGLPDGLYLIKQGSTAKGVDHYGILDVGNRIKNPDVVPVQPVVIHQTPPSIRLDWLQTTGSWTNLGRITDEAMALGRIREALKDPKYDLFGHNCEHFARFVATGRRESSQIQSAVVMTGLLAIAVIAIREAGRPAGAGV